MFIFEKQSCKMVTNIQNLHKISLFRLDNLPQSFFIPLKIRFDGFLYFSSGLFRLINLFSWR